MRAERAIYSPQRRGDSRGAPRSFAAQKALAQDDNESTTTAG
jgi:hypothetical protein